MARLTIDDTVAKESSRSKNAEVVDDVQVIKTEIEPAQYVSTKACDNKLNSVADQQLNYPLVMPF